MANIQFRKDLWQLVQGISGNAAEIGVAEGFFSAEMLSWSCNFPKVYMVDRWRCCPAIKGDSSHSQSWHDKNYKDMLARVAPYGDRAVILRGESQEMCYQVPDNSLALVYIDGDHSYAAVMRDIFCWWDKLVPKKGYMAFHDYLNPSYGVHKAVNDFAADYKLTVTVIPENKPEDAGAYFQC